MGRSHLRIPATAFGNIITATLARVFLHENVTSKRWLGILLITVGVGFVAGGPSLTPQESCDCGGESGCDQLAAGGKP